MSLAEAERYVPALKPAAGARAHQREDGAFTSLSPEAAQVARMLRPRLISVGLLSALARLADFLGILAVGALIFGWYVLPRDGLDQLQYGLALVGVPLAVVAVIGSFNGYALSAFQPSITQFGRIAGMWAAVFGCFTLALFFLKAGEDFSRVWLGLWLFGGFAVLVANRLVLGALVQRWRRAGTIERRAVLVGGGKEAVDLIRALRAEPDSDIRICGIFDDRDLARTPAVMEGLPRLGRIEELIAFGRQAEIDMLIVALPLTAEQRLIELVKTLWVLPVDIRLSAQSSQLRFRPRAYSHVGRVPFFDIFDRPIADWDAVAKRIFDIAVSLLALAVLSPVMLAAALAIRLESPGPVFFRQRRYGFNNEVIEVLKLRSMYHHMADPEARAVVTRNDPRVTRVGRFIRRTSIDELPQLFNVLRGELSLVGPRPHAVNAHTGNRLWEQVVDGYFARHRVKPGVTGWAQVNGWRGEVDCEEKIRRRVEHDLFYIENWSVLFDIYVLFLTPFRLFGSESAY
jgi:Undecaprenyl-phosphate glucose phosphotransferase